MSDDLIVLRLGGETQRKSDKNVLIWHFIHHKYTKKTSWIEPDTLKSAVSVLPHGRWVHSASQCGSPGLIPGKFVWRLLARKMSLGRSPVAARSKAWVSAARLLRFRVWIPAGAWISASCACLSSDKIAATGRSLVQISHMESVCVIKCGQV